MRSSISNYRFEPVVNLHLRNPMLRLKRTWRLRGTVRLRRINNSHRPVVPPDSDEDGHESREPVQERAFFRLSYLPRPVPVPEPGRRYLYLSLISLWLRLLLSHEE